MLILKENTNNIKTLEAGTYQAVCSGVWDIGLQEDSYMGQKNVRKKIIIRFEINKKIESTGSFNGKRYTINKFYTASLGSKSILRKELESWRGRPFTANELMGFDVEKLIGANCMLGVSISERGNAYISSISPLMKDIKPIIPELSIDMPEWVKKIKDKSLNKNIEYIEPSPEINLDEETPF